VTHTHGQTDVVEDRRMVTRGEPPRVRPTSLVRALASELGVPIEPTGFYVAPTDPVGLRRAIEFLLERPKLRAELGAAARRTTERLLTIEQFVSRLSAIVKDAAGQSSATTDRPMTSLARAAKVS